MPRAKPDLSRMVMLTMTPSQAVILKAILTVIRDRGVDTPDEIEAVLEDSIDAISLQLKYLKWPERNKAPFPV